MTETASPTPEGQEPSTPDPGQAPDSSGGQAPPQTPPPWGDDFDAERAWNTQQALRNENRQLKLEKQTAEREKMSELDRTKAERDEWKQKYETANLEGLRTRVLAEKGLPTEALGFLHGSTKEELEQNADMLKRMIGDQPPPPQRQPDFGAGARPSNGGTDDDASFDFSQRIRRAAGRA